MSYQREYRLRRTYWVGLGVAFLVSLFLLLITFDLALWNTWFTAWVTADNILPVMYGVGAIGILFLVLSYHAEKHLRVIDS